MTTYLKNTWYVAAWTSELSEGPFQRTILNEPVAIFRDSAGTLAAVNGRCPHRFAPLAMGRVVDDAIECPYHGLRFDRTGACVLNPHGDGHIPTNAHVRAYPIDERNGLVWIWPGDPALADTAKIPDFSIFDAGVSASNDLGNHLHVAANYGVIMDNLMDTSHACFVHEDTLNRLVPEGLRATLDVEQVGDEVDALSLVTDTRSPFGPDQVDQWLHMHWQAPATVTIEVGFNPTGEPRAVGKGDYLVHILTPETTNTTHYFYATADRTRRGPEERARRDELNRVAFENEDRPMLDAVQAMMGDREFWDLEPVIIPGDAAAMRVRRALDAMIAREQAVA